jgi:LmbE family N-acetylglucosaminyl deacetylase
LAIGLAVTSVAPAPACAQGDELSVLLVTAHPDDEAAFAAAVYRISHGLNGTVDLAVVTDGSGGYTYSHLAEPIYGLKLTDEAIARQYLPAIRKQELMAGGNVIGLRNYFFLDQFDHAFTVNADTVLRYVWDATFVRQRLRQIMERGAYDFVFVHLPMTTFHGHHQSATILALEAASEIDGAVRPVVLAVFPGNKSDTTAFEFDGVPGYPITKLRDPDQVFVFDRTTPLDESGRLNYQIIVNWMIAEHRSQGTMQLYMNAWDIERFWIFDANEAHAGAETEALFRRLNGSGP